MVDVLNYLEYRDFLKDWFCAEKKANPAMSYRYLSNKTEIDPAWLVRIFQRKGHLNEEYIPIFIELCGLDGRRAEYFKKLYLYTKTRSAQIKQERYYTLMGLREMGTRVLSQNELAYYGNW